MFVEEPRAQERIPEWKTKISYRLVKRKKKSSEKLAFLPDSVPFVE